MSSPINQPGSLLAAQVVSYNEGQKFQGREAAKEKERLFNMQMAQARQQKFMQKTPEAGKGILA